MNIKDYEFNGFKLYKRTLILKGMYNTDKCEHKEFNLYVQYKNGIAVKSWTQKITNEDKEQTLVEWNFENTHVLSSDIFIRNMTDEDVFTLFL